MNNKINMIKIKEDCMMKIHMIINVQLRFIELAKADKISLDEFEYMYDRLEQCKSTFIEMKKACDNTIKQYSIA